LRRPGLIRLEDIYLTLGDQQVLKGISLEIKEGGTGVILGASGSGKTTILRVVLGLYKPDSGRVFVAGDDITDMVEDDLYKVRAKMGMVFQGGALFDSLTVGENVGYRLSEQGGMDGDAIEERVRKSLKFVGLEESIDLMPAELSGGMKKRVAIARGIAPNPCIMLYDEPTAGLDPINSYNMNMLINRLKEEEGVTSVVVTHDLVSAFTVATSVALIHEGSLVFTGDKEGLLACDDERAKAFLRHAGALREAGQG
jgi:phospholipid/cholesterol/gamma-HCH transport system ATP-binding protein